MPLPASKDILSGKRESFSLPEIASKTEENIFSAFGNTLEVQTLPDEPETERDQIHVTRDQQKRLTKAVDDARVDELFEYERGVESDANEHKLSAPWTSGEVNNLQKRIPANERLEMAPAEKQTTSRRYINLIEQREKTSALQKPIR